jgi:molybdate transport system substrate-binding protein
MILPIVAIACLSTTLNAQPRKLMVAAASDLKFALDSLIVAYQSSHKDITIMATYGSSGKFFEQISNGAPFDLFFSADVAYPEKLAALGKTDGQLVHKYGRGRIVIWSRRFDPNAAGMKSLLDKKITKIAIANPEHAPYGRRAVEAMEHANIYGQVSDKLVYGENISQTAQFVTTGAADAGIVALSLALSPAMKTGKYFLIPESSHQPLEQAVVILKQAASNRDARTFQEFVLNARAKAILTYFGFSEPNR